MVIAGNQNNPAGLSKGQGKFADAKPLLQEALVTRRKALGNAYTATTDSVHALARADKAEDEGWRARPRVLEMQASVGVEC